MIARKKMEIVFLVSRHSNRAFPPWGRFLSWWLIPVCFFFCFRSSIDSESVGELKVFFFHQKNQCANVIKKLKQRWVSLKVTSVSWDWHEYLAALRWKSRWMRWNCDTFTAAIIQLNAIEKLQRHQLKRLTVVIRWIAILSKSASIFSRVSCAVPSLLPLALSSQCHACSTVCIYRRVAIININGSISIVISGSVAPNWKRNLKHNYTFQLI